MLPLGRFPVLRSSGCAEAYASIRSRHPGVFAFAPGVRESEWSMNANALMLGQASVVASESSAISLGMRHDGLIRIYLPLDKHCEMRAGQTQRRLAPGEAACAPIGDFECVFADGFRGLIVAIPQRATAEALGALDRSSGLADRLSLDLSRAHGRLDPFRRQLFALLRGFDDAPEKLLQEDRFRRAHEELLVLHLAQALCEPRCGEEANPGGIYLARALDYIHAHLLEEIGPIAIAQAAGCSLRNLQLLFRREFGQTITEMVRRLRLQKARKRLMGAGEGDRITTIAVDCGFYHLSDFARHYRREFGELPSQTLAHSRRGR